MKIQYINGDIFETGIHHIMHGCNAQGVMGSGVAKAVRAKYPGAFTQYVDDLKNWEKIFGQRSVLGMVSCYHVNEKLRIANAITQLNYGRNTSVRYVSYDAIDDAFKSIGKFALDGGWDIHIPKIGAGLGNGDWYVIRDIIESRTEGVSLTCWEL